MLGRPASCEPGLEERDRRVVIDRLGVHRLDEAELVGDLRRVRQQLADPGAGLAVLRELEHRRRDRETGLRRGHAGEPLAHADRVGQLGAAQLRQLRLVVEQIHLRRRAGLEQIDHALRLGREVRQTRQSAVAARRRRLREQRRAAPPAPMPGAGAAEEVAAGESSCRSAIGSMAHSFVIVSSRFRIRLATAV